MSFYRKIKYFLVHTLMLNNKEAQNLIDFRKLEIDGEIISSNVVLNENSEIKLNGKIVREKKEFVYLKFYKPIGFESTLNVEVPNNLAVFFQNVTKLTIAGRLDKESEGLLLLSNDGKWVEKMCHPNFEKEKEYEVILDRNINELFIESFSLGMQIGGHMTLPAYCQELAPYKVKIILKEGKNRQIRRMCHRLGYEVLQLKRVRVDQIVLSPLKPGEWLLFEP